MWRTPLTRYTQSIVCGFSGHDGVFDMTFKELAIQEDSFVRPSFRSGSDKPGILIFIENQSPIMKFWFAAMVINLVAVLFLL